MDYILAYNFCAIINFLVIIVIFYAKKYIPNKQNRLYAILIWVAFLATVADIMDVVGTDRPYEFSLAYLHLTSYGYFILHNVTPFIFCLYTLSLSGSYFRDMKRKKKIAIIAPIFITLLVILSTPITKGVFYYDEGRNYFRGEYLFVLYIVVFYYLVYSVAHTAICKDVLAPGIKRAVYSFYIISTCAVVFQAYYPQKLIENFAVSICIIIMFLAIQKPEELLDASTNVFNRNLFTNTIRMCFKHKERCTVCILHIEDMGLLTQAFGMEHTDRILKDVARFFEVEGKRGVYYLHSHTFGVLIKQKGQEMLEPMLEDMKNRFLKPWDCGGVEITLSFRACIMSVPEDVSDVDEIFEYIEQFTGEKKWENAIVYAREMDLKDKAREIAVERAVRRAVESQGFQVYYQPIYSIEKKRIISAEALIRLMDKELGMIPPDEFIPIAERDGTILSIGKFVFESVCKLLQEKNLEKYHIEYIQVNLSVIQCMQENLAGELLAIMKDYGIEADQIRLEITETAAANSPRVLHENMSRLHNAGIRFALDDFGTGYSNINSLADLPLETIKLDKSMIWAAQDNQKAEIILESSIAMIKKMNMHIVAEGIETQEQMKKLQRLGCDCLQGYYFSRPVEYESFITLLAAQEAAGE